MIRPDVCTTVGATRRIAPTPINPEAHELEERIGENVMMLLEEVN